MLEVCAFGCVRAGVKVPLKAKEGGRGLGEEGRDGCNGGADATSWDDAEATRSLACLGTSAYLAARLHACLATLRPICTQAVGENDNRAAESKR